jgi:hypothetical protein
MLRRGEGAGAGESGEEPRNGRDDCGIEKGHENCDVQLRGTLAGDPAQSNQYAACGDAGDPVLDLLVSVSWNGEPPAGKHGDVRREGPPRFLNPQERDERRVHHEDYKCGGAFVIVHGKVPILA